MDDISNSSTEAHSAPAAHPAPAAHAARLEFLVSPNPTAGAAGPRYMLVPYNRQQQYDYVRMVVTVGLLALFAFIIVWVAIKSSGSRDAWKQTEDMLQVVLPALTGLIGSVLGFYFGSQKSSPQDPTK
jgi:hypothetical protein